MWRLKTVAFLFFLGLVVAVVGVWRFTSLRPSYIKTTPADEEAIQEERDKITLALAWFHNAQYAGFYSADQTGAYKQQGIEVSFLQGGATFPEIQEVANGRAQFGVTTPNKLLLARAKGVPLVAVAAIYRKNPIVFFVLKTSGINKVEDFAGKRIGVFAGSDTERVYRALMEKVGVAASSTVEVPVKSHELSPLLEGKVDVWPDFITGVPVLLEEQGREINIFWPQDYGVNEFYGQVLFTTEELIDKNPDLVRRFTQASLEGLKYAYDHPDEAAAHTANYSDELRKEHEARVMYLSLELIKPDEQPVGLMEKSVWEKNQTFLLETKALETPVDIDQVFTTKFLN